MKEWFDVLQSVLLVEVCHLMEEVGMLSVIEGDKQITRFIYLLDHNLIAICIVSHKTLKVLVEYIVFNHMIALRFLQKIAYTTKSFNRI